MSNMSYCRFENTVGDLEDCEEHLEDENLGESEKRARTRLVEACRRIVKLADEAEL